MALLLSGLPTHVHAGDYAAALESHLASNSDALQQELHRNEHAPASGTTGARPCAWVPTGFAQGTYGYSPQSLQCVGYDRRAPVRCRRRSKARSPPTAALEQPCLRTRALQPPSPLMMRTTSPARPSRAGPGPLLYGPASYPAGSTARAAPPCTARCASVHRASHAHVTLQRHLPCATVSLALQCRSRDGLAAPDGSEPCSISSAAASGRRLRRSWRRSMPRSQLGIARLDALPARCARSARPLLHTRSSRARRCQEGAASARSKRYGQGAR